MGELISGVVGRTDGESITGEVPVSGCRSSCTGGGLRTPVQQEMMNRYPSHVILDDGVVVDDWILVFMHKEAATDLMLCLGT